MIFTILLAVLAIATCIQIAFGLLFAKYVLFYKKNSNPPEKSKVLFQNETDKSREVTGILDEVVLPKISVIICAKNEAQNLNKYLPTILTQRYGAIGQTDYEVIVVNDASTDATAMVLQGFREAYHHLKIVTINPQEPRLYLGKKMALHQGVAAAKYENLLFTDADCKPASDNWIVEMAQTFTEGKQLGLGLGAYNQTNGLLNAFVRWETMHTALQYLSYAIAGVPYMGVGRNLATTKKAFQAAEQLPTWNALPSGDDDLLVSSQANGSNTIIIDNPSAFTFSDAPADWGKWATQKQRHLSTGKYYPTKIKMLLGAYGLSHALFWLALLVCLFGSFWLYALLLAVIRCIILYSLWWKMTAEMQQKSLAKYFLLFDLGWMAYNFAFLPYIAWKNKTIWKAS